MEEQIIQGSSRIMDYGVLGFMLLLFVLFLWKIIIPVMQQISSTNEQQGKNEVAQTEILRQISENLVKVSDTVATVSLNIPNQIEQAKTEIISAVKSQKSNP